MPNSSKILYQNTQVKNKMSDITINKNTATTPGAPRLVLTANDKIYLATAVKSVDKLTFIYTLACLRRGTQYEINPTTEIATFDNAHDAAIYHKTVNQIMTYQQKNIGPQKIREMLADDIVVFMQQTR